MAAIAARSAGLVWLFSGLMAVGCADLVDSGETAGKDAPVEIWQIDADEPLVAKVAEEFSVEPAGARYNVFVPPGRVDALLRLVPSAFRLELDERAPLTRLVAAEPDLLASYRDFGEVESTLVALAADNPSIARLEEFGRSGSDRPLYAIKISDNVDEDEDEPELLLTAATHGDELITTEVLVRLLEELVAGYDTDPRLRALVDDHEIYFAPVVSPDSFVNRSRFAHGRDPNRDYPWPEVEERNPIDCIDNIMSFYLGRNFVGSLDFHASGKMVMYPWAYTYQTPDPTDRVRFDEIAVDMAADNGYITGQISDVIYVAKGSSADYYYWKTGSLAYGIELTTRKVPPASRIPAVVDEAREMTWRFIESF